MGLLASFYAVIGAMNHILYTVFFNQTMIYDRRCLFTYYFSFSILQTLTNARISRRTTVNSFVSIYQLRSSVTVATDTN